MMVHGQMAPADKLLAAKVVQPAAFAKPGPGSHEKSRWQEASGLASLRFDEKQ
jgi:hypothetical protein